MLNTIVLIIVAVIAVLLIYASTRPDTFTVDRSITIQASPEKVFPVMPG